MANPRATSPTASDETVVDPSRVTSPSDPEKKETQSTGGVFGSNGMVPLAKKEDSEAAGVVSQDSLPMRRRSRASAPQQPLYSDDGKRIITEEECADIIGFGWPSWKKWMLLSSIFIVQVSMNFNTSVYPNAVSGITKEFGVSEQAVHASQTAFLVAYAFGCELWAPWSEEFGRWKILQCSLFLVNCWQVLCTLAPNYGSVVVARFLGGLSSAGGSVTIGMVADLFQPEEQQWAIAFVVFSSVFGTSVGPVLGGPIEAYLDWRWNPLIQLIFGLVAQAIHFFMPESRATVIMNKEAKRRRKAGIDDVYGPNEVKHPRISAHEFGTTWLRPFEMFFREPIVLCCSLLSGFSDALIFTFQEGFTPVYEEWGFGTIQIALAFIPINIGYMIAYASYVPWIRKDRRLIREKGADALPPERRLWWLLYLAPLETIGLFGFAWTSFGPPVPWIMPMIFSCMIAIANFAIYMSTIDYMVASYGVYSASATGGNGFARDFLAGIAAMYSTPLYSNIPPEKYHLQLASTILACLALVITIPVYIIYWKGPVIRERSKFAQSLDADRRARKSVVAVPPEQLEPENI